jgi:hypothetical protein
VVLLWFTSRELLEVILICGSVVVVVFSVSFVAGVMNGSFVVVPVNVSVLVVLLLFLCMVFHKMDTFF